MDYGHKWTEDELRKLEKRITAEYSQAVKEVQAKLDKYLKDFEQMDITKRQELADGLITQAQYNKWREEQIFESERWEAVRDTLARDLHNVNEITASMTKEFCYEAYALNHNFGTYEVEKGSLVNTSYTLYDRHTVERLLRDDPNMLPPPGKKVSKRIAEGKDILWNKQQIQSVALQGILQGEPLPKIAARLAETVGAKNDAAALRNARTMTTGAENAGRVDSYKRAERMGIKMQQEWLATLDGHTRHEHRMLDGQRQNVGEPFEIDGYKIMFPGDPEAEPHLVYNCRCTLIGVVAGTDLEKMSENDLTGRDSRLGTMTYEEWKNEHEKETEVNGKSIREVAQEYDAKIEALNKSIAEDEIVYQELLTKQIMSFGTPELDEINKRIEEYGARSAQKYDELNALRDEKYKYLSQCGETEIRQIIGTINAEHSISDDLQATNRLVAGDPRSYNNCGYCALAYDARRRGIDCKAPYIYGANDALVSSWWKDFEYQNTGMYDPQEAANLISSVAEQWGVGARGIISIDHESGIGHTFEFEVDKEGKCRFVDAQTGIINASDAFETAKPGSVRFGRTDDKELTKKALFYLEQGGWGDDKYS